jgi:DNA-binding transcriptional regulator GbsR (MarR family)
MGFMANELTIEKIKEIRDKGKAVVSTMVKPANEWEWVDRYMDKGLRFMELFNSIVEKAFKMKGEAGKEGASKTVIYMKEVIKKGKQDAVK